MLSHDVEEGLQFLLIQCVIEVHSGWLLLQPIFPENLICLLSYFVSIQKAFCNIWWGQDSSGQVDQLFLIMTRWIDPAVLHQIHRCSDISLISAYPRELQIWMTEVLGTVSAKHFLAASEMSFCTRMSGSTY